ncbi:hypothetical protein DACRYDRAFT_51826, partial [Dacryopinax primogenitus]
FWSNAVPIMSSLLHFSLAGGFSSPRITRVLSLSSYLTPPSMKSGLLNDETVTRVSSDRTFSRLNETAQFVLEVMGAPSSPLMHQHASSLAELNQEKVHEHYLAATLASFSIAPLVCIKQMGCRVSKQEEEDFIALWRVVGYHLSVAPDILSQHFASPKQATKFLASCVIHLLDFSEQDLNSPRPPTIPILKAISERPPFRTRLAYHMALTRFLLGPKLSDYLGVDPTTTYEALRLKIYLFVSHYPKRFGEIYPRKDWEQRRVSLVKEAVCRLTRFNLGMRKTLYRPRDAEHPELEPRVKELETIVPDFEGGRKMVREYRLTLLEMGSVTAGVVTLGCVALWVLASG